MSQQVRETQRVPRTCIQCARRKIKCSKKVPCEACVRRGDSLACSREVVRVSGKITIAVDDDAASNETVSRDQLQSENKALKARVTQLEAVLGQQDTAKLELPASVPTPNSALDSPHPSEDILTTFQAWHFGHPVEPAQSLVLNVGSVNDHVLFLLPIRRSSEKIVQNSLGVLGWVHCALSAPEFLLEHEAFWDALKQNNKDVLSNHSWMAVYLSVLAVGVYFMDEEDVAQLHYLHEGFSGYKTPTQVPMSGDVTALAHAWYEAALKELEYSNFTKTPSLSTVQTLAILTLVHKSFGETNREYLLHGLAVNAARAIGMDRLGNESTALKQPCRTEWLDQSGRELGRRLWWTLVICDWMAVWSRPASITPDSFNSALSVEKDNSHMDIILRPATPDSMTPTALPSPLEYHVVMAKVAFVVQTHINSIKNWSATKIRRAFQELDVLTQKLPPHLSCSPEHTTSSQREDKYPWIAVQRHLITNAVDVVRINLCISFLPQLLETRRDEVDLHRHGLQAARGIMRRRRNDPSAHIKKFWGVPACTVAAGMFLALDLICFKGVKSVAEIKEQREMIHFCIHLTDQMGKEFGHGATTILTHLVHLHDILDSDQTVDRRMLEKIMKLVAGPPLSLLLSSDEAALQFLKSTGSCSDVQTWYHPDLNYNSDQAERSAAQASDMHSEGIGSLSSQSGMILDHLDFGISDSIPGINFDWSDYSFPTMFPDWNTLPSDQQMS